MVFKRIIFRKKEMNIIKINPKILKHYFNFKVREMCKSCKRYGYKTTCPPNIESVNYYKNLLPKYKYGIIYYKLFDSYNKEDWKTIGKTSSLEMHKYLLKKRTELISNGNIFHLALSAGSCKICLKCSTPCVHPDKALIPIEATGINIVKLMKRYKIDVKFPIQDSFYRIGLILYD